MPLRGSCLPMKTTRLSRPVGSACRQLQRTVRDDVVLALEVTRGRESRAGSRTADPLDDAVHQEPHTGVVALIQPRSPEA